MKQSRSSVSEKFRRTRRKIRFLARRGTLFHKTPRSVRRKQKKSRKGWRPFRLLKYFLRRGYKRYLPAQASPLPEPEREEILRPIDSLDAEIVPVEIKQTPAFRIRLFYRYVRFIVSTGKLFRRPARETGKKRKNKWKQSLRVIRYLAKKGSLFHFSTGVTRKWFLRKFSFMASPDYLKIAINSTFIFILAYFVIFSFYKLAQSIAGLSFNIPSVIYYYDTDYLIRGRDWTMDSVKIIFSAGPFISFLIAILSIIIFSNFVEETWKSRLFIFWIFCQAMTHSFIEMFAGTVLNTGFGYVIMYLFLMDTAKVVISIFYLVVIIFTGLLTARYFLFTGNLYFNYLSKHNRMPFLLSQFMFPFFAGTGILILIKLPEVSLFDIVVNVAMILFLLPAILRARLLNDIFFDENPKEIKLALKWIGVSLLAIFLFRVILTIGIRVG
jgi:hypothetical protein